MFNLNDLHKQANLGENKRPSQWRSEVRAAMERSANLQSDKQGNGNTTFATEQGVYAYAMWVSPEFYLIVVEAFTALVNGKVSEAQTIAQSAVQVAIDKAIENNRTGKMYGKQMSKALKESMDKPLDMIDTLTSISKGMVTLKTGKGREGYWQQARTMVEKLQVEYRQGKHFDVQVYSQYEKVSHHCTKRIAQVRANNKFVE